MPYATSTMSQLTPQATQYTALPNTLPTPNTSVEPNVPSGVFPPCGGAGGWRRITNFSLGTDTTGPWSGIQHWGQGPDGWDWWIETAPGHATGPVNVLGSTAYYVTKYFHAKAVSGYSGYSFWYSCTGYSPTLDGAALWKSGPTKHVSPLHTTKLLGVPDWVEAPAGAGPSGLGEVPMLAGTTWWIRQGDMVLRCDGVAAPQTPEQIQYDRDWRARAWGYTPPRPSTAPHHQPHQTQSQIQYDRDWRSRSWGYGDLPGMGDLPTAQSAAGNLMTFFSSNAPSRAAVPEVGAFQSAYNGSGLPGSLTVDQQYGPNTQAALQNVLNLVSPPQAAPQNVFSSSVPSTPTPDAPPTPITPSTPSTPAPSSIAPGVPTAVIVGGAALAGAALIWWGWKKQKRR